MGSSKGFWLNALFAAAKTDDAPALIRALKKVGPHELNALLRTPLMWAAEHGSAKCVEILLPQSHIEMGTRHGNTALCLAASNGFHHCVALLLAAGAIPAAADSGGNNPLMSAAAGDHVECLNALLPLCDPLAHNSHGLSASMQAARRGSDRALRILIEKIGLKKPSPSIRFLVWAAENDAPAISLMTLAERSSPKEIESALCAAARGGHFSALRALQSFSPPLFSRSAPRLMALSRAGGDETIAAWIESRHLSHEITSAPPVRKRSL